jgi:serine phosphatase RsbU (regulator of sigma subunit)
MTPVLTERDGARLLELYAADDLGSYLKGVSQVLAERFGREEFAIHLFDRRRKPFLEYESRSGLGEQEDLAFQPLRVRGGDLGRLGLEEAIEDPSGEFEEFCAHLALGLYFHKFIDQQGQLIDESLSHVQALKAMGEMLGELDRELVLNKILKFFVDLLDAEVGAAILCEDGEPISEACWGLPEEVLVELVKAVENGQIEEMGLTQRVHLTGECCGRFSLGSILHLTIDLQSPHSAQIFLVSGEHLEVKTQQRDLLRSCRSIGGIALQKALDHEEQIRQHRLNEQLAVAREIQLKLLPEKLPQTDRLAIAGLSVPAQFVGGDYFDVIELPGGDLLAIVADVSGKGPQAAIRMSGLQAITHSLSFQDLGPGEVLGRLNHILGTGRLAGHFITACCLRFSEGGRLVTLASAGHDPVIHGQADNSDQPTRLVEEVGGLPLGLRSDETYEETTFELAPGDRLLVYTDGMTDARNAQGEFFGEERLSDSLVDAGDKDAQGYLDGLMAELEKYRIDGSWPDDLTALSFYYRPEGTV